MTNIYHITHLRNLSSIISQGGLCCDRLVASRNLTPTIIGYHNLKTRRGYTRVPVGPQGTLSDYVPFYFATRSPMLYTISKGNVEEYQEGQDAVLHLVTSAEAIQEHGLRFVFTDGHAEFLVHHFLPWTLIHEIGAMTSHIAKQVQSVLYSVDHQPILKVHKDWYY